jgi:hypothetical protein
MFSWWLGVSEVIEPVPTALRVVPFPNNTGLGFWRVEYELLKWFLSLVIQFVEPESTRKVVFGSFVAWCVSMLLFFVSSIHFFFSLFVHS